MLNNFNIRLVNPSDSFQCIDIYRPYVESTAITFDYDVPTEEEYKHKIEENASEYPWLVCSFKDRVIAYAYASKLRVKAAYKWTVESTIYVNRDFHGKGVARLLYTSLFEILRELGYLNIYAGVALPNIKSESFHRSLGFYDVGTYKNIGYKFGKWHDVLWLQLHLDKHTIDPPMPKSIADEGVKSKVVSILDSANSSINKKDILQN